LGDTLIILDLVAKKKFLNNSIQFMKSMTSLLESLFSLG